MSLPSCEEVESVLDYDFTDLNMRLGVMSLAHHMLNVESFCSSAVNATLDSKCQLILVLTETDRTVLLIDKLWLQAAILAMSFSETTVRQLQCERSDETLVFASFIGAGSLIQKGLAHGKSAVTVSTGMKRRGTPFNDNPKCAERQAVFASNFANLVELLPGRSLLLVLFFRDPVLVLLILIRDCEKVP